MIAIRGAGGRIAEELIRLLPEDERVKCVQRDQDMPLGCARYLFAAGYLAGKQIQDQTSEEKEEGARVNLWAPLGDCERILSANPIARICVIGSESGFSGSYDAHYAGCKAALHGYVSTKKLYYHSQQLVCVAPGIVSDAGMTTRRTDTENLEKRKAAHPKGRFLTSIEVAKFIHYLLYVDAGYISGVTIRMNGGEHLWR